MLKENFSAEESLQLIQSMIEKTRKGFSDQSHYFLVWGWAAFAGFLAQFILKRVYDYPYHYNVWWITIVCIVITVIQARKRAKETKVRTYVNENMGYLWTGLILTFFVLSMLFIRLGFQYCYPFFIVLYGTGAFISGKILQFRPLLWGGIAGWTLAMIAVWFYWDFQMLFAAAAILFSYIIPGHLLRKKYHHT